MRQTRWLDIPSSRTTLALANTAVLVTSLTAEELALRPFTVVRTRGLIGIESDQGAVTEPQIASMGFAVVSDQAVAIGVGAVPTPETERASDLWFVFESIYNTLRVNTSVGFENFLQQKDFDSRAMRKVEEGQDIAVVIENSALTLGSIFWLSGRLLIKLH